MTLKIERFRERVRLSGDLRSEDLDQVRTEIERCGTSAVLDVEEVALVDLDGVQFLNRCEANGVAVVAYSPFGHVGGFPEPRSAGGRVLKAIADWHNSTPRQVAGAGKPACNQVLYHLRERAIEHAVIPWCEANAVAVVAYSPFGHAGGFPELHSAGARVLKAIADRHNSTPRQVALRFLTRRASLFAIPKAADPEHAEENAGAATLNLSAAEMAKIDAAFPLGARPRALPML